MSAAEAPSQIWLALPAVMTPSGVKAGFRLARRSADVSRRGVSSTSRVVVAPSTATSTGTISRAKRPSSIARTARSCERSE